MKGGRHNIYVGPFYDQSPPIAGAELSFVVHEPEELVQDVEEAAHIEEEGVWEEEEEGIAHETSDQQLEATREGEPPKLEEGFYEIEDIRRKRVRRGKVHYLIKWRGWPEAANTWEPYENLKSCADFIDLFEERSRSRARKRSRKKRPRYLRNNEEASFSFDREHGERNQVVEMVEANADHETGEKEKESDLEAGRISIQLNGAGAEEDGSMEDGSSKVEFSHPVGSKKRKSGSVRRFKQDLGLDVQDEAHIAVVAGEKLGNEDADSNENEEEIGNKSKKLDDSFNPLTITKILMPVRYHASVTDNVQQVSIVFKALRSDGLEVFVDDKDLKLNNPLLLISYYEQHLRSSPLS